MKKTNLNHFAFHSEVPRLRRRLAGKSTPIEKLAMSKCNYYFSHNRKLVLPIHVSFEFSTSILPNSIICAF